MEGIHLNPQEHPFRGVPRTARSTTYNGVNRGSAEAQPINIRVKRYTESPCTLDATLPSAVCSIRELLSNHCVATRSWSSVLQRLTEDAMAEVHFKRTAIANAAMVLMCVCLLACETAGANSCRHVASKSSSSPISLGLCSRLHACMILNAP